MPTYSNISIHITDTAALAAIERAAKKAGVSRSAFIFVAACKAAAAKKASAIGAKKAA